MCFGLEHAFSGELPLGGSPRLGKGRPCPRPLQCPSFRLRQASGYAHTASTLYGISPWSKRRVHGSGESLHLQQWRVLTKTIAILGAMTELWRRTILEFLWSKYNKLLKYETRIEKLKTAKRKTYKVKLLCIRKWNAWTAPHKIMITGYLDNQR